MLKEWGFTRRDYMWYLLRDPVLPNFIRERHTTAATMICWQAMRKRGAGRFLIVRKGLRGLWIWFLRSTRIGRWLVKRAQ